MTVGTGLPAEIILHVRCGDGSFHAGLGFELHGSLPRRPRSDAAWPELDEMGYPARYRWSDPSWDWFLGVTRPLSDAQVESLRRELA